MTARDDARDLAVALYDLAWVLPRSIGAEASRADPLPATELEIMRLLTRRPGLSVNDVAAELGLQSTNVSTAVRSLVARGLLERRTDAADGRVVRLEPTPSALHSRDAREDAWGAALELVLRDLDENERDRLEGATSALRALALRLAAR